MLLSLLALNTWQASSPALAAVTVDIEQFSAVAQSQDPGGESIIIRDWLGNPNRFLFLFKEGEDFTVYVDRGNGNAVKVAHISRADADACRPETTPNTLCKTFESDQGYETGLFSNGIGGLIVKVRPENVAADLTDNSIVPTAVPTSNPAPLTNPQFDARQEKNQGAAVDDSVIVVNEIGNPDPGLHIFREADGYAVYAARADRQGVKIAQVTALDSAACRPQTDTTEVCATYYSEHNFQSDLYSNGQGGLVVRVRPILEGPVTVDTNIRVEQKSTGLITIHGTGEGGASFLLTPSTNPETVVIIAEDGTWQTDVAFIAGKHIIKLQDMDANGAAVGVAAQVEVTIEAVSSTSTDNAGALPPPQDTKQDVAIE